MAGAEYLGLGKPGEVRQRSKTARQKREGRAPPLQVRVVGGRLF